MNAESRSAMKCLRFAALLVLPFLEEKHYSYNQSVNFSVFALMQITMDFPESIDQVKNCQSDKRVDLHAECRILREIKSEKDKLFQEDAASALELTLGTIRRTCRVDSLQPVPADISEPWNACVGASSALFFFSDTKQDKRILDFFERTPELLDSIMEPSSYPNVYIWFNNRKEIEQWRILIDSINIKRASRGALVIRNPFNPEDPISVSHQRRAKVLELFVE